MPAKEIGNNRINIKGNPVFNQDIGSGNSAEKTVEVMVPSDYANFTTPKSASLAVAGAITDEGTVSGNFAPDSLL